MMLDNASLVLFIASEMMAIEFESKPTNALNPAKTMFAIILITLVLIIVFSRLSFIELMVVMLTVMVASCFEIAFKLALCKKLCCVIGRTCDARDFF